LCLTQNFADSINPQGGISTMAKCGGKKKKEKK
jgi:hypothetical protein